jgi:hypothetical protein
MTAEPSTREASLPATQSVSMDSCWVLLPCMVADDDDGKLGRGVTNGQERLEGVPARRPLVLFLGLAVWIRSGLREVYAVCVA